MPALRSPTTKKGPLDLEPGSHHVMVHGSYTCLDDVSHLSDPTGLESTPPRQRQFSRGRSARRVLIRRPLMYLKRIVQRQTPPEEEEVHADEPEQELEYISLSVDGALDRPSRVPAPLSQIATCHAAEEPQQPQQHTLLSPREHHESDPLLLWDPSIQKPGPVLLDSTMNYKTASPRLSAATTADESSTSRATSSHPTTMERILSRWHVGVTVLMYLLLMTVCGIDLLAPTWSASAISLILVIGSATVGLYLVQLCVFSNADEPLLRSVRR